MLDIKPEQTERPNGYFFFFFLWILNGSTYIEMVSFQTCFRFYVPIDRSNETIRILTKKKSELEISSSRD